MAKPTGSKRKAEIVRKTAKSKACNHDTVTIAWHPETGQELSRRCSVTFGCGMQLSLGVANDAPADVQVEIRAAELEPVMSGGDGRVSWAEHDGVRHHAKGADLNGSDELPGWLAAELATHEERETRDADAWSRDDTRPVAGQYEERSAIRDMLAYNAAKREAARCRGQREWGRPRPAAHDAADQALSESKAVHDAAQTRHDVAASVARHDNLPGRVPYAEDQLPLPVVSDSILTPEQCSRCGRPEAPTCCAVPPTACPDPETCAT